MKLLRALIFLLLATPLLPARAQLPLPQSGPYYRYIILVDTSSAMARRKLAMANSVGELIYGSFGGRIRKGDVFGIWTFSDQVDAVTVPAQIWAPEVRELMTSKSIRHIAETKYRNKSNLDAAVKEIIRATKTSQEVTIFLFTDGNDVIYGTPYDLEISTTFMMHRRELASKRLPFVTSIAARDGRMQAWAVDVGGGKVTIPTIPGDEPKPEADLAAKPEPEPEKKPENVRRPPRKASPNAKPIVQVGPVPRPPKIQHIGEKPPPEALKPKTTPRPKTTPQAATTPAVATTEPKKTSTPTAAPTPTRPQVVLPRTANREPRPPPRATEPVKPRGTPRQAPPDTEPPGRPIQGAAKPPENPPEPNKTLEAANVSPPTATKPVIAAPPKTEPEPAPAVAATKPQPKVVPQATTPDPVPRPTETNNVSASAATQPAAPPSAQTALVLPPDESGGGGRFLALSLVFLAIVGVMLFLILRRARPAHQVSLISQSLDRERE